MDALQFTMEKLHLVQMLQEAKQREVKSIKGKQYTTKGRYQMAVSDTIKKNKLASLERNCNKVCSDIYDEINQARTKAGLPELTNHYKERK